MAPRAGVRHHHRPRPPVAAAPHTRPRSCILSQPGRSGRCVCVGARGRTPMGCSVRGSHPRACGVHGTDPGDVNVRVESLPSPLRARPRGRAQVL